MLRKTMAVGEEVWVTGWTGVANHRACCGEGFASARGRRGRIAAAGRRRAMAETRRREIEGRRGGCGCGPRLRQTPGFAEKQRKESSQTNSDQEHPIDFSHAACEGGRAGGFMQRWRVRRKKGMGIEGEGQKPDYSVPHPQVPSLRRFDAETDFCLLASEHLAGELRPMSRRQFEQAPFRLVNLTCSGSSMTE